MQRVISRRYNTVLSRTESYGEWKHSRRVRSSRWGPAPLGNWRQAPHLTGNYLQEVINRLYGRTFEVATLVRANCDDRDVQFFLDSDIGVFILEENRIDEAKQILAELKGEGSDETETITATR